MTVMMITVLFASCALFTHGADLSSLEAKVIELTHSDIHTDTM